MRAIKIDPDKRTVEAVDVSGLPHIRKIIGEKTTRTFNLNGHVLVTAKNCKDHEVPNFLLGTPQGIAGIGLVLGGTKDIMMDAKVTTEQVSELVQWMSGEVEF